MFNTETTLAGSLMLAPRELTGEGLMNLTTAELSSNHYRYKAQVINVLCPCDAKYNLLPLALIKGASSLNSVLIIFPSDSAGPQFPLGNNSAL